MFEEPEEHTMKKTQSSIKEYVWRGYTVRIIKKKVKHTNLRIKPEQPKMIHMSIPRSMTYEAAIKLLDQPRILRWIEKYQKKVDKLPVLPQMKDEERQWHISYYWERLGALLPDMFRKWELVLGVSCNKVTIRDTRSQWGSCSIRTKNISISVWLGAFPEECIEYVVVHELTHLLEAGHNSRFYGILDQYYPIWKSCREQLKNGLA